MLYCRSHFFLVWCVILQVSHLDSVGAVNEQPPEGCPFQCDENVRHVNCANRKLYTFPNVMDCRQQIHELDVSYNQIKTLPSDALTMFNALETMDLSHNIIQSIPTGVFRHLLQLHELYLQSNNLSSLQPGVFDGLEGLDDRLMLRCNSLTRITRGVFGNLKLINILAIDENRIETIETDSFNGMRQLGYLYLTDNRIVRLDRGVFSGLGKLKRLDLRNNRIEVIESGAFEGLSELTELKLSSNRITTVSSIVGLQHLSSLDIADNRFKTVDNQFLLDKLHGDLQISIRDNPLHCTCKMETLRIWYRQRGESTDGARCATPVQYLNITLANIKEPLPSCYSEKNTVDSTGSAVGSKPSNSFIVIIPVVGLLILAICVYLVIRWHTLKKQPMARKPQNNNDLEQRDEHRVQVQPDGYELEGYHTFLPQDDEHTNAIPAVEPRPPSLTGHTFTRVPTEDGTSDSSSVTPDAYLSFSEINGLQSDEDAQEPLPPTRPMLPISHTRPFTRPAVPPRFGSSP